MMSRIIFFILVLLFCLTLYLSLYYYTTKRNHYYNSDVNLSLKYDSNFDYNYPTTNFNQNSNDINLDVDLDIDTDLNKDNIKGYENELIYTSDDLKDGSYINQFKEIDYSKMKLSDNQIGFNPEPRCSSGALPFVEVNVNYLLKEKSL